MQNRRDFLKAMALGGVALGVNLSPIRLFANNTGTTKLTILHTNDCHSHIEPFPDDDPHFAGMGGFAERAKLINDIRNKESHVLVFDAGDIFQGTPYFNFFNGELEFKLMSKMNYDATTIGNHEFDNGLDNIAKQMQHANFPFVTSNYDFSDTVLAGKTKKHIVLKKGGLKIGVLGLGIELKGLVNPKNFGKTKFLDPLITAKEISTHLKEEKKCDFIICLSHLGYQYKGDKISDVDIAKNTEYIDLIIGGHTHTFLKQPETVYNVAKEEVTIVQAGWGGMELGRLDYFFEKGTKKKSKFADTIKIAKNQG